MSTFALDLAKFAEKAKERADEAVGAVVVGIAAELDKRSPVGDQTKWSDDFKAVGKELEWFDDDYVGGHFRANWQLGISALPTGEVPGVDPTGEATQSAIIAAVPSEAAGLLFYIANNVPYARRLEDGYSKQAPQGMVGLTVTMFKQIVEKAVTEAKP